jgi:hypothetical protein
MNPLAKELNRIIEDQNPHVFCMLSEVGKHLFFPKGILSQSAEAKEKPIASMPPSVSPKNTAISCASTPSWHLLNGIAMRVIR